MGKNFSETEKCLLLINMVSSNKYDNNDTEMFTKSRRTDLL